MFDDKIGIMKRKKDSLLARRTDIFDFEKLLSSHPEAIVGDNEAAPLVHLFAPGIYVRQITIPKGFVCTGKIHRHAHPNIILSGKVEVYTEEGGMETIEGPKVIISPAGTKRAVHALEETVWITIHATDETDLGKIEKEVIAESYEDLGGVKCLG